jgi:hypothetical protein
VSFLVTGLAISVITWLGGLVTLALLWPYGVLATLVGVPIGGSLAAIAAGLYFAYKRKGNSELRLEPKHQMRRETAI